MSNDPRAEFSFLDFATHKRNPRPPTLEKNSSAAAREFISKLHATLPRAIDGIALTIGYLLPAVLYTVLR